MTSTLLLVTAAWVAGADTAKPATPPVVHPAPIVVAGCAHGGCGTTVHTSGCCDSCTSCESACCEKEGLLSRLRGMFRRSNDCCETSCCETSCCETSCCETSCCERESLLERLRNRMKRKDSCCEPACDSCAAPTCCEPACNECGSSKGGLLGRLRNMFKKDECECSTCDTCAPCTSCEGAMLHHGGVIVTPHTPGAEKIGPPKPGDPAKKMPSGDKGLKDPGKVHVIPAPIGTPVFQPTPRSTRSPF